MSIQSAGTIIREARLKAGLSQEKLAAGICSTLSLSRIENGTAGVSPSTFQALMTHAGAPCEAFPIFADRADFSCFYTLKRARFYLDCWQLKECYEELDKIEAMNFAKNKFYYQEWLLLHCKLQFHSGCENHSEIYKILLGALHISRPEINFSDFRDLLLSLNEIELLIAIAQEALYLNDSEMCLEICTQISTYLENSQITFLEKDRLLAKNAIVYSKYLIAAKDYVTSLKITDIFRQKMIKNADDAPLHELTFLYGLNQYYNGNIDEALVIFKTAFFSAHSIASCYATTIRKFLVKTLGISLFDDTLTLDDIPLVPYALKKVIDTTDFSDGIYDLLSPDTLTLGTLIRELRIEQNISQQTLCYGLCSKSKLSKIENNTLQPGIALAQTLLQRLGISDAVFTFYGSAHETQLHNLKLKLLQLRFSDTDKIIQGSKELQQLCSKKDTFYLQFASYRKANCKFEISDNIAELFDTLTLSLPNFELNNLCNYRLSWLEFTILNNYCTAQCELTPSKGILSFYKIMEYYERNHIDVLEMRRFFVVTLNLLVRNLHNQKRYSEITDLASYFSLPTVRCSLYFSSIIEGNYAQALGEMQQLYEATLFANYAYYNFLITGSTQNANTFKNTIHNDFGIYLA